MAGTLLGVTERKSALTSHPCCHLLMPQQEKATVIIRHPSIPPFASFIIPIAFTFTASYGDKVVDFPEGRSEKCQFSSVCIYTVCSLAYQQGV